MSAGFLTDMNSHRNAVRNALQMRYRFDVKDRSAVSDASIAETTADLVAGLLRVKANSSGPEPRLQDIGVMMAELLAPREDRCEATKVILEGAVVPQGWEGGDSFRLADEAFRAAKFAVDKKLDVGPAGVVYDYVATKLGMATHSGKQARFDQLEFRSGGKVVTGRDIVNSLTTGAARSSGGIV